MGGLLQFLSHLSHFSLKRSTNHPWIFQYLHGEGVVIPVFWGLPPLVFTSQKPSCLCPSSEFWTSFSLFAGGTDIISCFMGQNFSIPVYKGEIQARNLGMAVEAWNEEGDGFTNRLSFWFGA